MTSARPERSFVSPARECGLAFSRVVCVAPPIAGSPRPFRRKPDRLSRGYRLQEEGLESIPRGYRPTIVVLHRGRVDPPPLKWSDLRYVFDIKEDCNGKE